MSEIPRILDQFHREHDGDPWHGSPLRAILEGVSAEQAAARAVADLHSIWEIVLHITAWKNEVRKRVEGAPAGEPTEGDWPGIGEPTAERWAAALGRLDDAHTELLNAIRALPESQLYEPTKDPRNRPLGVGVSLYVTLHGLVQHDVYHSGQIALIRKALGG